MLQKSLSRVSWKSLIQPWQELDWLLFLLPVGLMLFGGITIRSTQLHLGLTVWWQHWVTGGIGMVLALLIARWRYENLLQWRWIIYAITNISLLIVIFIGTTANGAQSWITLGSFNLQPSEFAKVGVIVVLASILHQEGARSLGLVLRALAVTALPGLLILLQPDLGTALVFGAITLGMLYWANANPGWLILLISPIVSAILFGVFLPAWLAWISLMVFVGWRTLPWAVSGSFVAAVVNLVAGGMGSFVWQHVLKAYQRDRLTLFLDPDKDPLGGGYHLIQSRIAIGAGQLTGRGLNQGTQTQLNFIPEQHTDFIFSAVGEEFGFAGCLLVLAVFWLICLRLVIIAQNSKDNFGSLLAIGMLSMIVFQMLINIGMTIGLAPITGIPLPWLSYGRSALLTNFIALGIVESVSNYRHRLKF